MGLKRESNQKLARHRDSFQLGNFFIHWTYFSSPRRKKISAVKTKPPSLSFFLIEFCRFIASFVSLDLTGCSPFKLCHIEHHKSQKIDKNVFISSLSTYLLSCFSYNRAPRDQNLIVSIVLWMFSQTKTFYKRHHVVLIYFRKHAFDEQANRIPLNFNPIETSIDHVLELTNSHAWNVPQYDENRVNRAWIERRSY